MDRFRCCSAASCREGRTCNISLPAGTSTICISGTQVQSHHVEYAGDPLCDCVVVWDDAGKDCSASVELKSGRVDVSHAVRQLQAGADLISSEGSGCDVYAAVLASTGKLRTVEMNELRRLRVSFRGQRYRVLLARCGTDLRAVLVEHAHL